jgi:hypothetical protein
LYRERTSRQCKLPGGGALISDVRVCRICAQTLPFVKISLWRVCATDFGPWLPVLARSLNVCFQYLLFFSSDIVEWLSLGLCLPNHYVAIHEMS